MTTKTTQVKLKLKLISNTILMIIFLITGIFLLIDGSFPITIEIVPTETQVNAYIHTKTMFPPFKQIDEFIPNVREAIIATFKGGKAGTTYRVELETYNNKNFPVTNTTWGYSFKRKLQNQINESIQNKTPFKKVFVSTSFILFGLFLILVSILSILSEFKKANKNKEIEEEQDLPKETIEPEQEKYSNINDSIIK